MRDPRTNRRVRKRGKSRKPLQPSRGRHTNSRLSGKIVPAHVSQELLRVGPPKEGGRGGGRGGGAGAAGRRP